MITVNNSEILNAAKTLKAAIENKKTQTVSVIATGKIVKFETVGTNLSLSFEISAESTDNCEFTINAQQFVEALQAEKSDELVSLEFNPDTLDLKITGVIEMGLVCLKSRRADFPVEKTETTFKTFGPAKNVKNHFTDALNIVGKDKTRPQLTGIYVGCDKSSIEFAATDAHKLLAIKDSEMVRTCAGFVTVNAPAAKLTCKLIDKNSGTVTISSDENKVWIDIDGNWKIAADIIPGKYPNYRAVIPLDNNMEFTVNKKNLIDTLSRISDKKTVIANFKVSTGKMEISCSDSIYETGKSTSIPCEYEGDTFEASYKPAFLIDVLKTIDSNNVCLRLKSSKPILVATPESMHPTGDTVCILMPLYKAEQQD